MKMLLPLILLVLGLAAGGAAGYVLRPAPEPAADPAPDGEGQGGHGADHAGSGATTPPPASFDPRPAGIETVRLPNQFVVPLIEEGRVRALVVIGLALELLPESGFSLPDNEARLRAVFLQQLFDHANSGGFDGLFTSGEVLLTLRRALRETAQHEVGAIVHDVLITELLRQEND